MKNQKGELSLPVSIIISGVIIAGAIMFTNGNQQLVQQVADSGDVLGNTQGSEQALQSLENLAEITEDDRIRGDINAPITIVEYSDAECPFCARAHETISQILTEYGDSVAWVYRHFPLTNVEQGFHVNAERAAAASECTGDLAGSDEAFWDFTDAMFASNAARNDELYKSLAAPHGVDGDELIECIDSGKFDEKIQSHIANAAQTGGRGTPWMIIVGPDGEKFPISGAQPIEVFRAVIDKLI